MWETRIDYTYAIEDEYGFTGSVSVMTKEKVDDSDEAERLLADELAGKYEEWNLSDFESNEVAFQDPSTGEDINTNEKTPETTEDIKTSTDPSVNADEYTSGSNDIESNEALLDDVVNSFQAHAAWDPRLYRLDEFFINDQKNMMRVPFASATAVTAFAELSNTMEAGVIQAFIEHGDIKSDSKLGQRYAKMKIDQNEQTSSTTEQNGANQPNTMSNSELDITNPTDKLEIDSFNWGVQSVMNPYSITKLVGGLSVSGDNVINYMYDIRDHRRFYSPQSSEDDVLGVSNPTITQLIKWSNADLWGRTPYSFQDFVYCKYFGLIPNNRLITLRRYAVPTYDNLQFENMEGRQEQKTQDSSGHTQTESQNELPENANVDNKTFSPIAYVVTWFGGDTGNSLSSLMNFSTGINWGEVKSDIWNVDGDTGETKQAVIDKFLGDGDHSGLFHMAELDAVNAFQTPLSKLTAKITSLGKFNLALNGPIGTSQDAFDAAAGANMDPWDSTYRNRVKGPIDRIDTVKKREAGIKFSQSLNVKCSYKSKAIGGINPKAALLDVLGNCLEMVSPHAVFWGGGYRFMVKPKLYPFHDGGWRDSFMAKVYDGKFLGDKGALATVLSGFKKVGENSNGEFNFDTAKDLLGKMGGNALGLLGQAISSLSDVFGGVDFLDNVANKVFNAGEDVGGEEAVQRGKQQAGNLLTNLKGMWHNRMMANTAMPSITAGGNLLIGEPVGEWHLTIGNPLNPIMVIGNLICSEMKVTWDDELGPDDFPTGFSVEYTLEHAMARDSDAIQSMFNRGMGKFYTLPDYMKTSSSLTTHVDKYTGGGLEGETGKIKYKNAGPLMKEYGSGYQTYNIQPGSRPKNSGTWNTTLITKFTPINTQAMRSVADRQSGRAQRSENVISHIRSLAATRKLIGN